MLLLGLKRDTVISRELIKTKNFAIIVLCLTDISRWRSKDMYCAL